MGVWTVWGETEADSALAQALNDVAAEVTVFERASDRFSTPQPVQDAVAQCAESA